ncbi:hypothetical protein EV182_003254, partial [Spiromyces aspiralis]
LKIDRAEKARLMANSCARMKSMSLKDILNRIGCSGEYREFIGEHEADVAELAKSLPKTLGPKEGDQQAALTPFLRHVVDKANGIWRHKNPTVRCWPCKYYIHNTHKRLPDDTKLRPDIIVSTDTLAQLGTAELIMKFKQSEDKGATAARQNTPNIYAQLREYACHMWTKQPTRRFIPVLLVHDLYVTLLLFTRHKVYRTKIGSALAGNPSNKTVVRLLLFLFSGEGTNLGVVLPHNFNFTQAVSFSPSCPGLFCQRLGVEVDYKEQIKQQRQQQPISPRPDNHLATSHFEIDNVVDPSQADLFGRIAFLARGTFVDSDGKRTDAVLKFVRQEAVHQTEGEAYGVLHWKGIPYVPELLLSGYADEWDGGVLECLVVADAGKSLREYHADNVDARRDPELLGRVATIVTQCLWDASQAGVYHRNISTSNICVSACGRVHVIDWGCAMVEPETLEGYRQELKEQFPDASPLSSLPNADEVARNEEEHDQFTSPHYFLSIRALLRYTRRSVANDLESLLYVLIHFVAKDSEALRNAPAWEKDLPAKQQALLKASAFLNIKIFYTWTGLDDLREPCLGFLQDLARRLFIDKDKGVSIMGRVLHDEKDPRESYDLEHWLISGPW